MTIEKILVVDDDPLICDFIADTLRRKNIEVVTAENGKAAIGLINEKNFDMIFIDLRMPEITGIDVLKKVKEMSPNSVSVIITGFGSIESAVEAMRLGAFNYLIKPFTADTIEAIIGKVNEHLDLVSENEYLKEQVNNSGVSRGKQVIASNPAMKKILTDVARVAKTNASVFITGESGTGKEVIAQEIYSQSLRANKPFIKVNCAAIPETLIESEFFGHEKGSFTGAHAKKLGRFELANGGTLMLDEVTEVPLAVQAKLLRAIQEQVFERVGGTKPVKVDVRIISTSNRDMKTVIENKILREDLFYRLNVVPIHLPALRDRKEDIIPLAEFFLEKACKANHKEKMLFTNSAKSKLLNYAWPGNVRELANIIERAVVMSTENSMGPEHLYVDASSSTIANENVLNVPMGTSLAELEKLLIIETLEKNQQNKTKAAEILGISQRTLRNKLKEYAIEE
jgi:two-component system response regulator AtoC